MLSPADKKLLQIEVNNFCAQTAEKDVHLETLIDLLFDLDGEAADRILAEYPNPLTIFRPGPVSL